MIRDFAKKSVAWFTPPSDPHEPEGLWEYSERLGKPECIFPAHRFEIVSRSRGARVGGSCGVVKGHYCPNCRNSVPVIKHFDKHDCECGVHIELHGNGLSVSRQDNTPDIPAMLAQRDELAEAMKKIRRQASVIASHTKDSTVLAYAGGIEETAVAALASLEDHQ
jgi:hypothetical protein